VTELLLPPRPDAARADAARDGVGRPAVARQDAACQDGSEAAVRKDLIRQVAHWTSAVEGLAEPANFASDQAWRALEQYLDLALRRELQGVVDRLRRELAGVRGRLSRAGGAAELEAARRDLVRFRRRYGQAETVLEFYGDAVNRRTGGDVAVALRACDVLAAASLEQVLPRLGHPVPPVLTYVDKGMGASILRHGLRLWDPSSVSPAAAVKITRHNLFRPTSLIHETGHQVGFAIGWNDELAELLGAELGRRDASVAAAFTGWTSEVSADVFAFLLAGYGSLAALHDVVAGEDSAVFRFPLADPHPIAYLRVLLGVELCRAAFGSGPWDDLAVAWKTAYPARSAPAAVRDLLASAEPLLATVANLCLHRKLRAFGGRAPTDVIDPRRVSPAALEALAAAHGPALWTSPPLARAECLRILALSGLRFATRPHEAPTTLQLTKDWMHRLAGGSGARTGGKS
jgi:hypothetical protein